jgi:hypothetical protein
MLRQLAHRSGKAQRHTYMRPCIYSTAANEGTAVRLSVVRRTRGDVETPAHLLSSIMNEAGRLTVCSQPLGPSVGVILSGLAPAVQVSNSLYIT